MEIRLEAYTPPAKRQFGYYITPILWGHQLIGRLDPKADRAKGILILRNMEINLPKKLISEAIDSIREELERYMVFNGMDMLQIIRVRPAGLKKQLV
jgi:uncharacterized protein YcaQ